MILVSPTEPIHVKALGKVSSAPEDYGCDVLLSSRVGRLGIQRKKFPEDLVASISDGRLSDQLVKMAELSRACVVLVGYPVFTRDGDLVMDNWSKRKWNFDSIWGAVASIALEAQVGTFWVRDEGEFVDLVGVLERWNKRTDHSTTRTRSRPKAKGWGISRTLQQSHFIQGLPSVGPELADRIVGHFGGLPMRWSVGQKEMLEVPGVGKAKVAKMGEMIGWDDESAAS